MTAPDFRVTDEPTDPDVDLHVRAQRRQSWRAQGPIVAVVALGASARYGHRLVRPFFGTGVLGGFTTFSTYAVDIQKLVAGGRPRAGLAYLAATPCAALAAVWLAAAVTRRLVSWRQR
jgi:CrcB protein